MPRNPLRGFVRRKSSGNLLDTQQPEEPAQSAVSTFKVLERPNGATFPRTTAQRPMSAMPFGQFKGKSTDDLRHLGTSAANRGSAITTNSGSSGYYDTSSSSARYSSSSTLPSSFDQEHEQGQEELFPVKDSKQTHQNNVLPQAQASAGAANPSFSSRATKAMGFGFGAKKKQDLAATTTQSQKQDLAATTTQSQPIPALPDHVAVLDRATTISSYASTAVPPRLDGHVGNADYFSTGFDNMFEGLAEARSQIPLPPPSHAHGGYMRSDSEPSVPTRSPFRPTVTPSPEPRPQHHARPVDISTSSKRYSWQSRSSTEELMSSSLDADLASPKSSEFSQDTVKAPAFARFRPGYQAIPLRQDSPGFEHDSQPDTPSFPPHQGVREHDNSSRQKDGFTAQSMPTSQVAKPMQSPARVAPSVPALVVAQHPAIAIARENRAMNAATEQSRLHGPASQNENLNVNVDDDQDPLFDVSPGSPAYLAAHNAFEASEPAKPPSPQQKRMTRAQFEMQQAARGDFRSEHSDNESDDGYDDGDEEERQAELIRQRRKQEANLAVYRQQMMKASGGQPSDLSQTQRPGLASRPMSAPLLRGGLDTPEEEDDDVPLGILQAHGFPNKNRPPTRTDTGSAPPGSQGLGGPLPPFARRLPQMPPDPYYGAGLVSTTQREGLGFGGHGGSSAYGSIAPSGQPMHPGGLVGVIADEEQAKARRRGSPNPVTGGYGPIGLPNNMMPRSGSMMSMGGPMSPMGMPGMNPMDNQAQMLQMMQMQQQMMQSIIQLQSGQTMNPNFRPSASMQSLGNGYLNPNSAQRPVSGFGGSTNSHASNAGRSSTMVQPPPQWQNNAANGRSSTMTGTDRPFGYAGSVYDYSLSSPAPGYTHSIAPSERSNVGMPSRYRPVSIVEANGRTQTMVSNMDTTRQHASRPSSLAVPRALSKSTIRVVDKPKGMPKNPSARHSVEDDEDDEEGWAQLRAKREARKSRRVTDMQKEAEPSLSELYTTVE